MQIMDDLLRAIAAFEVEEFDLPVEPDALTAARRSLADSGLLLLGEVHGVRENPLVILTLMRLLGLDNLALEWPEELTGFLRDGTPADHPFWWLGDGRITAGHFAVLGELGPLPVMLFDSMRYFTGDWSARDAGMAAKVLETTAPTLVVAGNAHTELARTVNGLPMGACLTKARPGVRDIRLRYGRGGYYNGESRSFDGATGPAGLHLDSDALVFNLPEVKEATVPHLPPARLREELARIGL
ncbi:hypothetical protein GCM10023075_80290 [Streptosporangium album]